MVVCLHEYTNDGISVDQECNFARLHIVYISRKIQSEAQASSNLDMVSDCTYTGTQHVHQIVSQTIHQVNPDVNSTALYMNAALKAEGHDSRLLREEFHQMLPRFNFLVGCTCA